MSGMAKETTKPITEDMLPAQAEAASAPVSPAAAASAAGNSLRPGVIDAQWTCRLSALDERGQPAGDLPGPITVGTKIHMACEGATAGLEPTKLKLELPKEAAYSVRLLETVSLSGDRAEFLITSWTPGTIDFKQLHLTDGVRRVDLGEIKFDVKSVITPETNPESKPYDAAPPVMMIWPLWVWLAIAVFSALVITVLVSLIRQSLRRKRLLLMLEKHPIALSPYHQFNKDLRRLSRQSFEKSSKSAPGAAAQAVPQKAYLGELNQSFRWFLARELVIPSLDSKPGEIVAAVRRVDDRLHRQIKRDLQVVLSEIDKALNTDKELPDEDLLQLTELSRNVADKIAKSRAAVGEGRA
jgi:hypothetical protein